jgi:hypothetical protein
MWDIKVPTLPRESAHRWWGCQPSTGRALLPRKIFQFWYSFCRRLSKPQYLLRLEGLGKLIKFYTSSGLEPTISRLVPQCLKHHAVEWIHPRVVQTYSILFRLIEICRIYLITPEHVRKETKLQIAISYGHVIHIELSVYLMVLSSWLLCIRILRHGQRETCAWVPDNGAYYIICWIC